MRIAVDFDGTIVENKYPEIGETMMFAFETLLRLQQKGHQIILWTYRHGRALDAAIAFCKENGLEFYAANQSYPEEGKEYIANCSKFSRKIEADVFIDDRNIGGFVGWGEVWHMIYPDDTGSMDLQFANKEAHNNFKKRPLFKRWFQKEKRHHRY